MALLIPDKLKESLSRLDAEAKPFVPRAFRTAFDSALRSLPVRVPLWVLPRR